MYSNPVKSLHILFRSGRCVSECVHVWTAVQYMYWKQLSVDTLTSYSDVFIH